MWWSKVKSELRRGYDKWIKVKSLQGGGRIGQLNECIKVYKYIKADYYKGTKVVSLGRGVKKED